MLIKKILIGLVVLASCSSCEKWFDVRPSTVALATHHFSRESGFEEQLIGVYTKMASTNLYGRDMSYGFVEVLSQNYDIPNGHILYDVAQYRYTNMAVKSYIETVWTESYNAIANLNIMLDEYKTVSPKIFSGDNYTVYQAEALGLRAFLHFDMLRLFGPSVAASGLNAQAIPYMSTFTNKIAPTSTTGQVLTFIKDDLNKCLDLYNKIPKKINQNRFSRYAALATLARVYQWEGDLANAKLMILELLKADDIPWVPYALMESSNRNEWDRVFSLEHIFRMAIRNLDDNVSGYFTPTAEKNSLLNMSPTKMDDIFEVTSKGFGGDYRYRCNYEFFGSEQYFSKYRQFENSDYKDMLPLIKKGEMYLILAEAELKTDKAAAVKRLNEIRENRGSIKTSPLIADQLTETQVATEIAKEYRKELMGEGQLFYYYKRKNVDNIPGTAVNAKGIYKLPLPDNEIEFGNR